MEIEWQQRGRQFCWTASLTLKSYGFESVIAVLG